MTSDDYKALWRRISILTDQTISADTIHAAWADNVDWLCHVPPEAADRVILELEAEHRYGRVAPIVVHRILRKRLPHHQLHGAHITPAKEPTNEFDPTADELQALWLEAKLQRHHATGRREH